MKSSTELTFLTYCVLGLIAQVYIVTIIVIIVIFSEAIIKIEKFQYRPSVHVVAVRSAACVYTMAL